MPWNDGGPNGSGGGRNTGPWGNPDDATRPNPRPEARPHGPWGGGPRPQPGSVPDFDELVGRAQKFVRDRLPPGFGGGGSGPRRRGGLGGGRLTALIVAALMIAWLASGFYRVQPDEQGVVRQFGAYDRTTQAGLNYHMPWPIEAVERPAVTRINRVEVGYRTTADIRAQPGRDITTRDVPEESLMLTGDENIIDIDCAVFWRIRDASAYLFATRNPGYTVKSVAESVLREVIGRTPIQPALTDARAQIEAEVAHGVQVVLDQYGTGVEITQVQLQKVDPPAAVIDSFRDVQRASTDAERMRNEAEAYHNDIVPRARGDAARILAEADANRQAAIARATGEAQRFLSVLKAYNAAKDVTLQRIYLETMESILRTTPSVIVDERLQGIVPFLPLGESSRANPLASAPVGPTPSGPAAAPTTPAPGPQAGRGATIARGQP